MSTEPGGPEPYDVVDLIRAKRDGDRLSGRQIDWLLAAYVRGVVADEQMAALAMAIVFRGLDRDELDRWTSAMIATGERLDFAALGRPSADKHSTGGVGDKTTLPLVPVVAACGVAVPQLLEAQGPGMVDIGQVAHLEQHLHRGGVVAQHGQGLAPGARAGAQGRQQGAREAARRQVPVAAAAALVVEHQGHLG